MGRTALVPAGDARHAALGGARLPPSHRENEMLGKLGRAVGLTLVAWFAFVFTSLAFAASRRRTDVAPTDPAADEIDLNATLGPLEFRSEATAFRGGRVTTWFGGGVVDLRGATLAPEGATIETSTLFGGGSLIVPDEWTVETHVVGIGGVGDGRPTIERSVDAPTLRLEGVTLFGGWGITSRPADERPEQTLVPV
jgi:hypothetical protein